MLKNIASKFDLRKSTPAENVALAIFSAVAVVGCYVLLNPQIPDIPLEQTTMINGQECHLVPHDPKREKFRYQCVDDLPEEYKKFLAEQ